MGQSTNGILFYGICFDDDEPEKFHNCEETEELVAAAYGCHHPSLEYTEVNKPIFEKYWKEERELLKKIGCEVGIHCSCDYPMYYVCITTSHLTAYRGTPQLVGLTMNQEDWDKQLQDFCAKLDIPFTRPDWYLASLWC